MGKCLLTLLVAASLTAGCTAPVADHPKNDPRPAGTQTSGPETVLTSGVTQGIKWEFTSFKGGQDEDCIAVNYGGTRGVDACGFEVNERYPIDAAIEQVSPQVAAIYGEAVQGVADVEVVRKSSTERVATFVKPNSGNRYFVVLAVDADVTDVYVNTPAGRTSLKDKLSGFYAPG